MDLKKSWRPIAASLVGVSLLTVASISFAGAHNNTSGNRAASAASQATNSGKGTVKLGGVVDLSKLPTLKSGAQNNTRFLQTRDRMTPEQRAAYQASLKASPRVTAGAQQPMAAPKSASASPSFVGGGTSPLF